MAVMALATIMGVVFDKISVNIFKLLLLDFLKNSC